MKKEYLYKKEITNMNELRIFYVWDDEFIRLCTSNAMTKTFDDEHYRFQKNEHKNYIRFCTVCELMAISNCRYDNLS